MHSDIQSYRDIGQVLHDRRLQLALEIRDVAQQLHIRAKYLSALEEGELEVMPGKVYARGYLRQYTMFLGLDVEAISKAFDQAAIGEKSVKYFVPEPTGRVYQPGSMVAILALVAVFGVYMYWYRTHQDGLAPPEHEIVAPVPERMLAPEPVTPPVAVTEQTLPVNSPEEQVFVGPPVPNTIVAEPVVSTPIVAAPAPEAVAPTPEPEVAKPAVHKPALPKRIKEELPWLKNRTPSKPTERNGQRHVSPRQP